MESFQPFHMVGSKEVTKIIALDSTPHLFFIYD